MLTLDLHAGQIQGFFDIPTDNLFAVPVMARDMKQKYKLSNVMVVSPDVGGVVRARALAKRIDAQLAIVDKRRERPGESEVMNIIGDVDGKDCLLYDDIVDSGGTLCNAADALLADGAASVTAYITHGVLSGGAVARIAGSKLKELVITDSIQPIVQRRGGRQHPRHLDRRPDRRGDLAHRDREIGVEPVRLTGQNAFQRNARRHRRGKHGKQIRLEADQRHAGGERDDRGGEIERREIGDRHGQRADRHLADRCRTARAARTTERDWR